MHGVISLPLTRCHIIIEISYEVGSRKEFPFSNSSLNTFICDGQFPFTISFMYIHAKFHYNELQNNDITK